MQNCSNLKLKILICLELIFNYSRILQKFVEFIILFSSIKINNNDTLCNIFVIIIIITFSSIIVIKII